MPGTAGEEFAIGSVGLLSPLSPAGSWKPGGKPLTAGLAAGGCPGVGNLGAGAALFCRPK